MSQKIILTLKLSHQKWEELAQRGSPFKGPVSAMKRGCCRRAKRALINDCRPVKLPNWVEGYLSTKKATALLCVTLTVHITQVRQHSQPSNRDRCESTVPDRHNVQNSLLHCVTAPFYRVVTYTLWCAWCSREQNGIGAKIILILSSQTLVISDLAFVLFRSSTVGRWKSLYSSCSHCTGSRVLIFTS